MACSGVLVGCGGGSSSSNEVVVEEPVTPPVVTDPPVEEETAPNVLFIISDDQGLDASAQYSLSNDVPDTPTLNELANSGLTFENMWATPACSTTRATIITGMYGINSGVESLPGNLSTERQVLQSYLKQNESTSQYQSAVFGKWHLATGNNAASHPNDMGIDYYAGNISNIDDYFNWSLTINGDTQTSEAYHTTAITDLAIDWIENQQTPWFAWVAYSAPHSPFHLPPEALHNRNLSGDPEDIDENKRDYYLAAIEAMDSEIGRLLDSLTQEARDNTIVIFIGDNGTPNGILDNSVYANGTGKGTLYQGGVAVPFIVSGKGVTRQNERESSLVTATDIFATIAEIAGAGETQIQDSKSFASLLTEADSFDNDYVYTAYVSDDVTGWTVRNQSFKLIELSDGSQQMFSLENDFSEGENLLPSADSGISQELSNLDSFARMIVGEQSTGPIDITNVILENTSQNCVDYIEQFTSTVNDINNGVVFNGDLTISHVGDKCMFQTNAIPNHDFNDGGDAFANDVSEQNDLFEITTSPTFASQTTAISLTLDNAIMLNGVKVDLLAAGCFGIGNGKVGCNDINQPWRYDPMFEANGFRVDSHNAHAQPDGTYHYHGSPNALFDVDSVSVSPVIGFAADGFPIFGSNFDDNGSIRPARSSYRLKSGSRPTGDGNPGGIYDGSFRDDYEYVEGEGDLDECNGMTVNGVYGYYVTEDYPYILACFKGTPDTSFNK